MMSYETHLLDGTKDREAEMGLSRLLRRDTTDHASAVRECLFYMESTLTSRQGQKEWSSIEVYETHSLSRETLAEHPGVCTNEKVLDRIFIAVSGRGTRESPTTCCKTEEVYRMLRANGAG